MSWSKKGANNISKILAVKSSGKLYDKVSSLLKMKLPEKFEEVYEELITNVKKNEDKIKNKVKLYPVKESEIPFSQAFVTEGRKAIRNMFNQKLFTEMIYR